MTERRVGSWWEAFSRLTNRESITIASDAGLTALEHRIIYWLRSQTDGTGRAQAHNALTYPLGAIEVDDEHDSINSQADWDEVCEEFGRPVVAVFAGRIAKAVGANVSSVKRALGRLELAVMVNSFRPAAFTRRSLWWFTDLP